MLIKGNEILTQKIKLVLKNLSLIMFYIEPNKKTSLQHDVLFSGPEGIRTPDLLHAMQAL